MPKRKTENNAWKGFVRCELGAADKAALAERANSTSDKELLDTLEGVVDEGYKFSLSSARGESAYTASLYDVTQGRSSHGYTLTAYGRTGRKAILSLLYKHIAKLKEDWTRSLKPAAEMDEDFG